jgi:RimJ/RimL family protein N-acetyltransferase
MTYFLTTDRIGFRTWAADDLPLAMALWGDSRVTRFLSLAPMTDEQVKARLEREIATQEAHGFQYWPLFLRATEEHLGCCGLRPYKPTIPEVGVHLGSKHWGKGYATEAVRAVLGYAFDRLGAVALFAGHSAENDASRQLIARLGFRYIHDEFYPPTGQNHPSYLLTADEYRGGRFRLRAATNADGEAIRHVVWTVLVEFGFTPDPAGTDADLADVEVSYLRTGGSFDVLTGPDGAVVGTVGLFPLADGRCELRKMYLSALCRGRGLGKRLLRHALDRARQLGFRRVELETVGILRAAIRLYESFGFRPFVPDHMSAGPGRADRAYFLDLG